MKTLEQMGLDPAIQAEADRIYEAAPKLPRPSSYLGSESEWESRSRRFVGILVLLSRHEDSAVAAWALMVIEGLVKQRDGGLG